MAVCSSVYCRLCIDLMHILPPVTAEGLDGSHHPKFAECWPPCITTHVGVSGAVASLLRQVTKLLVYHCANRTIIAVIDIFIEKRKSCNHRCPDFFYFHMLLLIIYLTAIERLICRREMSITGSTSFGFTQNTIHDFQNTVLNS